MKTQTNNLDAEQLAAVESTGNTLVLAGPGSGKTTTLIEKIIFEVGRGKRVVALTFTCTAADLITQRLIDRNYNIGGLIAHVGTLHSFCLKLLRQAGNAREIADEGMLEELISDTRTRLRLNLPKTGLRTLLKSRKPATHNERVFLDAIDRAMAETALIDYDGVLRETLALGAMAFDWHDATLIVDEIQDSAAIDLAIYGVALSFGSEFWAVGDLQQSIFGFRHPEPVNVWGWWQLLKGSTLGGAVRELPRNYRSYPAVVRCCNTINKSFKPRLESVSAATEEKGGVYLRRFTSENAMLQAIANHYVDKIAEANECAVLVRTWKEAGAVVRALAGTGVSYRTRSEERTKNGVPPLLWAALMMWQRPNDWRVQRYATLRWGESAAKNALAKSRTDGKPLIGYVFPAFNALVGCGTTLDFQIALGQLGISAQDEAWMRERVGKEWPLDWDEFVLRLLESPVLEEEGHGVTVTTVHSAKGREWRDVIVAFCDDQSYRGDPAENDRILFVAASRAIETLSFMVCDTRTNEYSRTLAKVHPARGLARLMGAAK